MATGDNDVIAEVTPETPVIRAPWVSDTLEARNDDEVEN